MATALTPTEYRLLVEHSPVMIVRAHDGELQVDSSPERGTTFRLVLPSAAA